MTHADRIAAGSRRRCNQTYTRNLNLPINSFVAETKGVNSY